MTAGDRVIRVSTAIVVVGIATVAAYVSYRHALEVVEDHGETGATARLVPLTVDGLVYCSSMVLLDSARRGHKAPSLARWTLGLGIAATLVANVLHGVAYGPVGAAVAAWPAVCLVLTYELLMLLVRGGKVAESAYRETAPDERVSMAVDTLDDTPAIDAGDPEPLIAAAREMFAETLTAGDVPSVRQLRRELRIGHPRAVRIRAALNGSR